MSDRTCGNCMLPIQPNEPGIRHYGFYAAHAEYRCYALLRERAERAETELARVTAERDQYRLERDQRGAEATEFHLERDEARAELASLRAELAKAKEDREHWYLLALERAQRIDELEHTDREVLCAQAVEFAEYVTKAAKGSMVERAEHFLAAPYAKEVAERLSSADTLRAELEALSRRIAEAPIATVKHYDYFGEWALLKEASMTIFEPLKGHRVALVRIDGDKA